MVVRCKKKVQPERTERMLKHKARFFLDNHWSIEEIAAELKITIPAVMALLRGESTDEIIPDLI